MNFFDKVRSNDLERRELQLNIFACTSIVMLTVGTALLMYPLVFAHQEITFTPTRNLHIAFFGFIGLSLLLTVYLWERQHTIHHLREEMAVDRRRIADAQKQASVELLKSMSNLASFQDRLPMEFRRTVSTSNKLSILVVNVKLPPGVSPAGEGTTLLGDAAKVISRRLRDHDSIYMLDATCFGVVLPGADIDLAGRFAARVTEGLSDAAGAGNRFAYKVRIVNYPADASSATELEQSVCALLIGDNSNSMRAMAQSIA